MSRLITVQELNHLVAIVAANPAGIGIDELLQVQDNSLQRRSLQRRLASLVAQGRIQAVGEARAVRYRVAAQPSSASVKAAEGGDGFHTSAEFYVPTSIEGEAITALARLPRQLRPPVGYKLEFLEQYHPNHTAYLPSGLRDQLHALGRSPASQAPAGTFARDIRNRLLIDLSWASSQLEGNTYSRWTPNG